MKIRPMEPSDIPSLRQMYEFSGLEYTFPDLRGPQMESVLVAVDDNDIPIAAVAAEKIVQLYLLVDETLGPAAKLAIIRKMHENMGNALCSKGYCEANCFVPPKLEKSFGRRLMRNFGWQPNWKSWCKAF